MPGIAALGKLFFQKNLRAEEGELTCRRALNRASRPWLIIGKLRLKSRRWSKYLVTVDHSAALSPRKEFVFPRVRRDDRCAAGGRAVNQSSIGRNANHSSAR